LGAIARRLAPSWLPVAAPSIPAGHAEAARADAAYALLAQVAEAACESALRAVAFMSYCLALPLAFASLCAAPLSRALATAGAVCAAALNLLVATTADFICPALPRSADAVTSVKPLSAAAGAGAVAAARLLAAAAAAAPDAAAAGAFWAGVHLALRRGLDGTSAV
jgi:hypothetical protein